MQVKNKNKHITGTSLNIDSVQKELLFWRMKKWYLKDGLKDIARYRFMTLPQLQEATSISRTTFDRYKNADVEPHPDNIKKIAETLNMKYGRDEKGIYFYEDEIEEHDEERREDYNKPGMSKIISIVGSLSDIKRIKLVEFLECGIGNDGHNQSI